MNLLSGIILTVACKRKTFLEKKLKDALSEQKKIFQYLMELYDGNDFAKKYGISSRETYEEFQKKVPVVTYEEFFPYIERMLLGKSGVVKAPSISTFAKSSGTTNAKSKYIPLTKNNLKHNHYQAGRDMIVWAVAEYRNTEFVHGKTIGTTGSFSVDPLYPDAHIGDVSAHLFHSLPWYARRTRVADSDIMLHDSWQEKLVGIGSRAKEQDVRTLLGTPTWMIHIFDEVLKQTGKETISHVWPKVSMFFHGAVRFDPYKKVIEEKIGRPIDCMNIYNASEGFFGFQYKKENADQFVLLTHHDIFYEFISLALFRVGSKEAIPLSLVTTGIEYVLVITTSGGLVRYVVGDTIRFVGTKPFVFVLTGRTKQCLNTFGEEVVLDNIEEALRETLEHFDLSVSGYTVAPEVFGDGKGRHVWAIEFVTNPENSEEFSVHLDQVLQKLNSDYEAKRTNNLVLSALSIEIVSKQAFMRWLEKRGKLGGQHKIPVITEDISMIKELKTY